jgi:20S proteasome alpha/beta subunit
VTMAVGFLCRDGVVVAADRQVTGTNYTFPECKLIHFGWKHGCGILAYSGTRDTFTTFAAELGTRLPNNVELTDKKIKELLKDCLKASVEKKETFLTIMGYWIEGHQPSLIMSSTTQRIVDVPDCEVIGYGDSPLARSLLGRFRLLPRVSVHQARVYAVDFIAQAKKYDGQYVGDDTDVYSIDNKTDPSWMTCPLTLSTAFVSESRCVRIIDAGEIRRWESQIAEMRLQLDMWFNSLIDNEGGASISYFEGISKIFRLWATGKATLSTTDRQ